MGSESRAAREDYCYNLFGEWSQAVGPHQELRQVSLIMETGAQEQLIFKHAISTISQARRATGELRAPHTPLPHVPGQTEETSSS